MYKQDISKEKKAFTHSYNKNQPVFITAKTVDDLATPIGIYLRLKSLFRNKEGTKITPSSFDFILESMESNEILGRYSILGFDPDKIWVLSRGEASISEKTGSSWQKRPCSDPALTSFKDFIDSVKATLPEGVPSQSYGVYGYLGYDAVRLLESGIPDRHTSDTDVPDGIFIRPSLIAVFDRVTSMITITVNLRPSKHISADEAWEKLNAKLAQAINCLSSNLVEIKTKSNLHSSSALQHHIAKSEFAQMVESSKKHILAGDVYQIVVSQKFSLHFPLSSIDYYRSLRRINPAPFLFHLDFNNFSIIGASPEILARLRNNEITLRPLAGTHPRGKSIKEDKEFSKFLLADQKERSEHLMLLDLGRNDAGRCAKIDSVFVEKSFQIEYFKRVMHISSTIKAIKDSKFHPLDVLLSALPAGTVSGAPKIRAMQLIDDIEPARRGFYAGTIGYFDSLGNLDSCIALRTAMWKNNTLHFQAGAGIVADSSAENEYQESMQKLKAMIDAVEEALRFF